MPLVPRPLPRTSAQVVKSIDQKSEIVRDAVAILASRITWFQDYLAKLPGRVESRCFGPYPDGPDSHESGPPIELCLRLAREGKDWILSCATHDPSNDECLEFRPLLDAPLKVKLAAIGMFPDLLESIEKSQDELTQSIVKATDEFDRFVASLNAAGKAGK